MCTSPLPVVVAAAAEERAAGDMNGVVVRGGVEGPAVACGAEAGGLDVSDARACVGVGRVEVAHGAAVVGMLFVAWTGNVAQTQLR